MDTHTPLSAWLLALAALLVLAVPASAQRFGTPMPVPPGARVTLELDKPSYFLGENILVHFRLENVGDKPFSYSYGGDYRGGSRSLRFQVTAVGPDGRPVADPDPSGFNMGGMGASPVLKPGQRVYWSLPLIRYCRLDEPGRYTLHIKHDLGWTETPQRPTPVGSVVLTLLMPTPAQARQVLQEMDALPSPTSRGWGEKSASYPDFSALRYPVYLPLLRERAEGKTPQAFETALQGIGNIPTPEATQALLKLAGDPDTHRALQAAFALNARLPDPELQGALVHRSPFQDPSAAPRKYLTKAGWREGFAPAVRAHAHEFLTAADTEAVICGAFMLECVGTSGDLPALLQALDLAIQKAPALPLATGSYPRAYGACTELERATLVRLQDGATPPAEPRTPAEQDMFLQALAARPQFRPTGWEYQSLTILDGPIGYMRARALATMVTLAPLPPALSAQMRQRLPHLLLDPNEDVQVAACGLAQKIKDPALRAPVLQALASARHFPLPNDATNAAYFQGLRWEALKFWADCLDDPARKQDALGFLVGLLNTKGGYGSDSNFDAATGAALKAEWDKFLLAHRQEIQDGQRYSVDAPEVRALFPKKIFLFGGGTF